MRLTILQEGHGRLARLLLRVVRADFGFVPGPLAVFWYRSNFFGRHFGACLQEGLRGATHWSKGETELFAAFVAYSNRCRY